jgi:hypothetical protein
VHGVGYMADHVDAPANAVEHWPVEEIPDEDTLFRAAHKNWFFPDGDLKEGYFRDYEMSCDWCKYSTPEDTRARRDNSDDNAVIEMSVSAIRSTRSEPQRVEHAPIDDPVKPNQAHTHVIGNKKSNRVRSDFHKIFRIRIPLPPEMLNG